MSSLQCEEVVVGRHFKIRNDKASIEVLSTKSGLGVWFNCRAEGSRGDENCFGAYAASDGKPYVMYWPPKEFFDAHAKNKLPFALSQHGLQIPVPSGGSKVIPLAKLAELLLALADGIQESSGSGSQQVLPNES